MRRSTRTAIAKLTFLITERSLYPVYCACRRQCDPLVTAEIRQALDAVEASIADEPDRWISYVETNE